MYLLCILFGATSSISQNQIPFLYLNSILLLSLACLSNYTSGAAGSPDSSLSIVHLVIRINPLQSSSVFPKQDQTASQSPKEAICTSNNGLSGDFLKD